MFDIDAGKILILGVIALVVLGPKELPRVMRQVGSALGKMRRMAAEFQTQFMDAMKESEMEELKKDMQKMADQAKVDINYDPVAETNRQIRDAIDGKPARPRTRIPNVALDSRCARSRQRGVQRRYSAARASARLAARRSRELRAVDTAPTPSPSARRGRPEPWRTCPARCRHRATRTKPP